MAKWNSYTPISGGLVADADLVPYSDEGEAVGSKSKVASIATLRTVLSGASNITTTAPGVGDDDADGYRAGSIWLDTTGPTVYICTDASTGAAVWSNITAGVLTASSTTTFTNKTLQSFTNLIDADNVHVQVENETGGTLTKGTPVYVSGFNVGASLVEVTEADASTAATMPAIGLIEDDITTASAGSMISSGIITGMDTSAWSVGDVLYVSETAGALTSTAPTGDALVQPVATVLRSNVAAGVLLVSAAPVLETRLPVPINAQTGTTYTLVLADAGKLVTLSNAGAITLTVPTNASVAFPVGTVVACAQIGAGLVSFVGDTGVTINGTTPGSEASAGQYSTWSLTKLATDTWLASGGLA